MIGIFGGTFDPVHLGHIKPALDVKDALSLEQLRFIPCSIPAHRDTPIATVEQRLTMLAAAIEGYEDCIIDEREFNRQGVSYMVDTLQSLHEDYPESGLCLIIGMDAFLGLHRWSRWQSIFKFAHCVVTYRPGSDLSFESLPAELKELIQQRQVASVEALIKKDAINHADTALLFIPVTQLDISATDIRQRIKQEQSITDLVPATVNNIIQQQHLYIG